MESQPFAADRRLFLFGVRLPFVGLLNQAGRKPTRAVNAARAPFPAKRGQRKSHRVYVIGVPNGHAETACVQAELQATYSLSFSDQPNYFDQVVFLPNGSCAVIYYAQNDAYQNDVFKMDVFSSDGNRIFEKAFCSLDRENDPTPYAQIVQKKDHYLLEYYPDITSMEVCYQTNIGFDGTLLNKEKRIKLKYGEASYVRYLGHYMIQSQAHDVERASGQGNRNVVITNTFTGNSLTYNAFDWQYAVSVANSGKLLMAQRSDYGMLQISVIDIDHQKTEKKIFVSDDYLLANPFSTIASIAWKNDQMIVQIHGNKGEARLLYIDPVSETVNAVSVVKPTEDNEYIASILYI